MSTSIRDSNPLQPAADLMKNEQLENPSTPLTSILSHPKQKITAQFKRAITMIKQRSEPNHESSPPRLLTSLSLTEKANFAMDASLLTSLTEEPTLVDQSSTPKSQPFMQIKSLLSSQETDNSNHPTAATVLTLDPIPRINQQNQNISSRLIKPPSHTQTLTPQIASPSIVISPTPSSSNTTTTTTTTGELTILVTNL